MAIKSSGKISGKISELRKGFDVVYAKKIHRTLAIALAAFIVSHLLVHLTALFGPDAHTKALNFVRVAYGHPVLETVLVLTIVTQMVTGASRLRFRGVNGWARAQVISGLYILFFLAIHASAAIYAHNVIGLDTDFYWAAGSLHFTPIKFGFSVYYFLAVLAIFTHLAAALHFGWPNASRVLVNALPPAGVIVGLSIILIFSGAFYTIEIPPEVAEYFQSNFPMFELKP